MGLARTPAERQVVALGLDATVAEAARLMAQTHAGAVVIEHAGFPKGILTDRDITLRVVAAGLDAATTRVSQVMSEDVVTAPDDMAQVDVAALMAVHGVRRIPLVSGSGRLVGLLALDDLLSIQGYWLSCLARAVTNEQGRESRKLENLPREGTPA